MREFLLGVIAAALVYFAAWYQLASEDAPRPTTLAVPVVARQAGPKRSGELRPTRGMVAAEHAHTSEQRSGLGLEPSREALPAEGMTPSVQGLPAALPKVIEQMAALQDVAADPKELAARVQMTEISESDLAELKAFAERFVVLPPDRTEQRISGSSGRPEPSRKR